ncbi:hypothetical protein JL722_13136 [Aureococcus anophagefferens]|nr:hypothetical protein JL722_13136 [Aureococcus anophagefferens]
MDLDLAEIIDDGESGAPDYDVDDDYERQYLRTVNEALKRQIEQQHTQLAEYLKAKNDAERVAHESELRMAKMAKNAEIDARAREGQVKRVRVMEHQMKEVLEESDKERRQRAVAEEKTAELHKALNRERAQRLHDLHQNFRIAGTSAEALRREKEMEDRYFAAEKEIAAQAHEKDVLVAACEAHAKINVATVREERAIEEARPKKKGKGSRIKPREVGVDVDEEDRVEFSRTGTIISKEASPSAK